MKSYSVPFDQRKLILSAIFYFLCFGLCPITFLIIPLNPLTGFLLLTVCYFLLKAAIRALQRIYKKTPICCLMDKEIEINSLTKTTKTMKWNDVDKIVLREKHHALQFMVYGKNIDHPSGVYMIHIDYPFASKQLLAIKQELLKQFKKHKICIEVFNKETEVIQDV